MRIMDKNVTAAKFLLGGIGTGNISVNQNGRFVDFEIFGTPDKGLLSPYTFFAIHTENEDGEKHSKALESQKQRDLDGSHGQQTWELGGLPRFQESRMMGKYPFLEIELEDVDMPVSVIMESFTPFIPLNTDDSSLPGAVIRYRVKNNTNKKIFASVAGTFANLGNFTHYDIWPQPRYDDIGINRYFEEDSLKGIYMEPKGHKPKDLKYIDMTFSTTEQGNVTYLDRWNEGAWWDGIQDFWNDFTDDGMLTPNRDLKGTGNKMHNSMISLASLCVKKEIEAGEEKTYEFILSWYKPNRIRSWDQLSDSELTKRPIIKNYHAKFGNSKKVSKYIVKNLRRLEGESKTFTKAIYSSTLPLDIIEAVVNNITVIRSNTCFRVEDGTFFGYEGEFDTGGCCEGNCNHVWNYAQTLAFLFPELERSMRETEFLYETNDDGFMNFRAHRYLEEKEFSFQGRAAADGQLGSVIRLFRDWQISGDSSWLKKLWPAAQKSLEYAFTHWDRDGDGVIESEQHNTYDIEFYGANSMMNSIYYTALLAAEKMARHLGEIEKADLYASIARKGSEKLDEETFNGEYYIQKIDDVNEHKYQYGQGCLADQLFGQQLAHVNGLGYVLPEKHVKSAVKSIHKYNFLHTFSNHANLQRTYALNDEKGMVICTWPNGGRPEIPFVYSDEVWTGIEYHVASHLIYEGYLDEAYEIVSAVRARHDGRHRSPWNEVECGHHYARALSSYALLLAASGFKVDGVEKKLYFSPKIKDENFDLFFSCADGWGMFKKRTTEKGEVFSIDVLYGNLDDYKLVIN